MGSGCSGAANPFAGELVRAAFEEAGVVVRTGTGLVRVHRPAADGEVTAELDDGTTVVADEILVATGRSPRTAGLGLETVGLTADRLQRGYVPVDDSLAVTGPGFDGSTPGSTPSATSTAATC